ncbi:MAG: exo-alpha-sialidase [Balneola sp.]
MRFIFLCILSATLLYCSSDQTYNVQEFQSPSGENASLPRLFTDNAGIVYMSWVESIDDTSKLYYSTLVQDNWSSPKMISESDNWFVNWADYPSVIGKDGKVLAAHWLNKSSGGTYAYNVEMASSKDNWNNPIVPHSDNTPTEHGFVSMAPVSDSTFIGIWLDGRNTAGSGHDGHSGSSNLSTAMTLRSAMLDLDLNILEESEIDNSVCDCCGTSITEIEGGFIAAYRNRTEDEIRDIYVSKFKDGSWSNPTPVHNDNWNIAGCPVNGPSIKSNGKTVITAWFTGANGVQNVKFAISNDEGDTFEEPIIVDNGNPLGRVDIEFLEDETFLVSWLERNMEDRSKAQFLANHFSSDGELLNEYQLTEMSSSRSSGFPQISSYNGKIIAAWTDLGDGSTSSVKTAILE